MFKPNANRNQSNTQMMPMYLKKTFRILLEVRQVSHATVGWSGGAMVLGKLPVPGRPTNLVTRAMAHCALQ